MFTRRSLNGFQPNFARCSAAIWKCTSKICDSLPYKTWGKKTAYFGWFNLRQHIGTSIFGTRWAIDKRKNSFKPQWVIYILLKVGELWPTNGWDLVANVHSLPACTHGGHRTRINQTLPHVLKWTRFENDVQNLQGSLALKRGAQNCLYLGGFSANIFGKKRSTCIDKRRKVSHLPKVPTYPRKIWWTLAHERLTLWKWNRIMETHHSCRVSLDSRWRL